MVECMSGMDAERRHLRDLAKRLGDGLSMLSGKSVEPSHIEPLIVGDARRVVELSRLLAGEGYKVLPIRTPTVPPGTERLRFSLSAAMTLDEIDGVVDALGRVMERSGVELK